MEGTEERRRELYKQLGERVCRLRNKLGLTQAELASAISLSRTSVTNIEKGRQQILLHTLCDLASALQVNPARLLPSAEQLVGVGEALERDVLMELSEKERQWIRETSAMPLRGRS